MCIRFFFPFEVDAVRKKVYILFICALFFFSAASVLKTGLAWYWNGCNPGTWRYYSNPLLVLDVTGYRTYSVAAANSWNNAPVKPDFGMYGMPAVHDIGCVKNNYGANGWAGYTFDYIPYNLYITHSDVKWNSYYMDNYSALKKQSVCCHEYGHTLGAADSDYMYCIMYYTIQGFDQTGIYTPQSDDIAGVNYHYP